MYAIRSYYGYLSQFPDGVHALNAHFYLAELYSKKNLPENARPLYEYVVSKPPGEFTEQAIVKLSETYLNRNNFV